MSFAKDNHMIQTLTSYASVQSFGMGVLPGTPGSRKDFIDAHVLHTIPEALSVDAIAISHEIPRSRLPWEGLHNLLGRPSRCRMRGDAEVDDPTTLDGKEDNRYGFLRRGADAIRLLDEAGWREDWWWWACVGSAEFVFGGGRGWGSVLEVIDGVAVSGGVLGMCENALERPGAWRRHGTAGQTCASARAWMHARRWIAGRSVQTRSCLARGQTGV